MHAIAEALSAWSMLELINWDPYHALASVRSDVVTPHLCCSRTTDHTCQLLGFRRGCMCEIWYTCHRAASRYIHPPKLHHNRSQLRIVGWHYCSIFRNSWLNGTVLDKNRVPAVFKSLALINNFARQILTASTLTRIANLTVTKVKYIHCEFGKLSDKAAKLHFMRIFYIISFE